MKVLGVALVAVSVAFVTGCGSSKETSRFSGAGGSGAVGGAPPGTGSHPGIGGGSQGAGGATFGTGGTDAGACHKTGEPCASTGDCCGANAVCNPSAQVEEWVGCQVRCAANSDCATGCCQLYQGQNSGFCTDAKWCACGTAGSACGGNNPACCSDHVCLDGTTPGTSQCQKKCTQASDCPSACCVAIPGLGGSACLAKTYCP